MILGFPPVPGQQGAVPQNISQSGEYVSQSVVQYLGYNQSGVIPAIETQKFTLSIWQKNAVGTFAVAPNYYPFRTDNGVSPYFDCYCDYFNGLVEIRAHDGSAFEISKTDYLTDPSFVGNNWTHECYIIDTTQAVAADRLKRYINGVLDVSFVDTTIALNESIDTLGVVSKLIQFGVSGFDAIRLAEIIVTRGQDNTITEFGVDDGGTWKRKPYAGAFGDNGVLIHWEGAVDFASGLVDQSGNGLVVSQSGLSSQIIVADAPPQI